MPSPLIQANAILLLWLSINFIQASSSSNATDILALLSFKAEILEDPSRSLASWDKDSLLPFCRWQGVTCRDWGGKPRVTALDLSSLKLAGSISPVLANLTFLERLFLSDNRLYGPIPPELGHLLHLQHIDLSSNTLQGAIPTTLGSLPNLISLILADNQLVADGDDWEFLTALSNCSNLQKLDLLRNGLSGRLPTTIGNLSARVEYIDLAVNKISGGIPPEIGNLVGLKDLFMRNNLFAGSTLPDTISKLPFLRVLSLAGNGISGSIPDSLGNNSQLLAINLATNSLTGRVPPSIGNISSLVILFLGENNLTGVIPSSLANLSRLMSLDLAMNQLSGVIPPTLWNHSALEEFGVFSNMLTGMLPPDLGLTLPRLRFIVMSDNRFRGHIPPSLSNATMLEWIMIAENSLAGTIPQSFGTLHNLTDLLINDNQLGEGDKTNWGFLNGLANCSKLQRVDLGMNKLGGEIPVSIGSLPSGLYQLQLGANYISGSIPDAITNFNNLSFLGLSENYLTGNIPTSIGRLQRLQLLHLGDNKFSGEIPTTIGNLTMLTRLYLYSNDLSGNIPSSLAKCPLELLDLNSNRLTGRIPKEILSMSSLSVFLDLSHNSFTGSLPIEVGALKNLMVLNISNNNLTGRIPASVGQCEILEYLNMSNNFLYGNIPYPLQKLRGLKELDLSCNNLSGPIPEFFGNFSLLKKLNLSFNNLQGEVPKDEEIFRDPDTFSVLGNNLLCGGHPTLNLPPCSDRPSTRKSLTVILIFINLVLSLTLLLALLAWFFRRRRSARDPETVISDKVDDQHENISYSPRDYAETSYEVLLEATDGFSSSNFVGAGRFGTVYKGVMNCDGMRPVAVKVLNLQQRGASKSFLAECKTLRNIRHRNLIKVLTLFSGYDCGGNEFRALVFDYMPNGSLDMWLNSGDKRRLSLVQRLNIATDVASALNYLHHHAPTQTVHCDLKPGNVLLDHDMNAHVGDFGLAKLLVETTSESQEATNTIGLRGSIGYIPPEYGMTSRASTQGDVYSYGILLLEMFTGKSPTNGTFTEGMTLSRYVETAWPERVLDITDPWLLAKCDDENDDDDSEDESMESHNASTSSRLEEFLTSIFRVGISCTKESPKERMHMGYVTKELRAAKSLLL